MFPPPPRLEQRALKAAATTKIRERAVKSVNVAFPGHTGKASRRASAGIVDVTVVATGRHGPKAATRPSQERRPAFVDAVLEAVSDRRDPQPSLVGCRRVCPNRGCCCMMGGRGGLQTRTYSLNTSFRDHDVAAATLSASRSPLGVIQPLAEP